MRMLRALSIVLLVPAVALATDPPHWSSANTVENCETSCHSLHNSAGDTLTKAAGNVTLCQSCHRSGGAAADMAIADVDKADLATGQGTSHAFDAPATNTLAGALPPQFLQMSLRIMSGNVVCSTCHNQHAAKLSNGGTAHLSAALQITALGSSGGLLASGTYSGARGQHYLIEIVMAGDHSSAKFRYSKDNGTSWFPTAPATLTAGPAVALDSGITLTFAIGTYSLGERWQFHATWPFLRKALDSEDNTTGEKFCRDCHRDWVMGYTEVETGDGQVKSHPVGLPLGSGGRSYDRAAPLDGNGMAQTPGDVDGNPTNDLTLDSGGNVQCLTCHAMHFADSNTLSVDGP